MPKKACHVDKSHNQIYGLIIYGVTFSPTSRWHMHIGLYQLDIKNDFSRSDLVEEAYTEQQLGFVAWGSCVVLFVSYVKPYKTSSSSSDLWLGGVVWFCGFVAWGSRGLG